MGFQKQLCSGVNSQVTLAEKRYTVMMRQGKADGVFDSKQPLVSYEEIRILLN